MAVLLQWRVWNARIKFEFTTPWSSFSCFITIPIIKSHCSSSSFFRRHPRSAHPLANIPQPLLLFLVLIVLFFLFLSSFSYSSISRHHHHRCGQCADDPTVAAGCTRAAWFWTVRTPHWLPWCPRDDRRSESCASCAGVTASTASPIANHRRLTLPVRPCAAALLCVGHEHMWRGIDRPSPVGKSFFQWKMYWNQFLCVSQQTQLSVKPTFWIS